MREETIKQKICFLNLFMYFTFYYRSAIVKFNYFLYRLLSVAVQERLRRGAVDDVSFVFAERSVFKHVEHFADACRVSRQRDQFLFQ